MSDAAAATVADSSLADVDDLRLGVSKMSTEKTASLGNDQNKTALGSSGDPTPAPAEPYAPPAPPVVLKNAAEFSKRYPLPSLDAITVASHGGVARWNSWAIPGRILVGEYPGSPDDGQHIDHIESLLKAGVDCMVCLQNEINHKCPTNKWKRGLPHIRPYIDDMRYIANALDSDCGAQVKKGRERVVLIQVNMPEGGVVLDASLTSALRVAMRMLMQGRTLYIHSWAGHGRTGIMTALLLNRIYGLSHGEALTYTQKLHDQRGTEVDGGRNRTPTTSKQRAQVTRLCQQGSGAPAIRRSSKAGPGKMRSNGRSGTLILPSRRKSSQLGAAQSKVGRPKPKRGTRHGLPKSATASLPPIKEKPAAAIRAGFYN